MLVHTRMSVVGEIDPFLQEAPPMFPLNQNEGLLRGSSTNLLYNVMMAPLWHESRAKHE